MNESSFDVVSWPGLAPLRKTQTHTHTNGTCEVAVRFLGPYSTNHTKPPFCKIPALMPSGRPGVLGWGAPKNIFFCKNQVIRCDFLFAKFIFG